MASANPYQTTHAAHPLRGPHVRGTLSPDQRDALRRWLEETHADAGLSVRDVASFLSDFPPLVRAVLRSVQSARFGGIQISSLTHAVALLGIRRTRNLMETFADAASGRSHEPTSG